MIFECPGSSKFKHPQPEEVKCPRCAETLEIWTDEVQVKCPKCKKIVTREQGQSCLDWCRYAKECVGEGRYNNYMKNKQNSVKYSGKEKGKIK
jgi:ribosomal protein S27E